MSLFQRYDPEERARYSTWQMWRFKLEGLALGLAFAFVVCGVWAWLS